MSSKIVYMGTPEYARAILDRLIEADDMDVSLVLTQPDRPVGRKKILTAPPVKDLAVQSGIGVLQPERLSDEGVLEAIRGANPDYIVVAAFGQILPKKILDIAPCINLHASLLPQYRGASPVQQSLLNGDSVTGVTSMLMDEGLDTGDVLEYSKINIPKSMRVQELMSELTRLAGELTLSTLRDFQNITPQKQDDANSSLCKKIKKSDGEIDFVDANAIYDKYRAFEGWPGIFGENGVKFDDVELIDNDSSGMKKKIAGFDGDKVLVECERGVLKIGVVQPASKKAMSAKAYCVGRGLGVGNQII